MFSSKIVNIAHEVYNNNNNFCLTGHPGKSESYLEAIRKNIEWLKQHNKDSNKEGKCSLKQQTRFLSVMTVILQLLEWSGACALLSLLNLIMIEASRICALPFFYILIKLNSIRAEINFYMLISGYISVI